MTQLNLGTSDAAATVFGPPLSRWTRDRDVTRDICVERSRAGFLAARLLELRGDCISSPADLSPNTRALEETRAQLGNLIQRYARLLMSMGESPRQVLVLVSEIAIEASAGRRPVSTQPVEELQEDLLEWVLQATV